MIPARVGEQIVGRERRERLSQLIWCGRGCFDSRRRVNSDVRRLHVLEKWDGKVNNNSNLATNHSFDAVTFCASAERTVSSGTFKKSSRGDIGKTSRMCRWYGTRLFSQKRHLTQC